MTHNLYKIILEDTLAGYWDWNIAENIYYLSPAFKAIFGYEEDELPNTRETLYKLVVPNDRRKMRENFLAHTRTHGQMPFHIDVRFIHKNGSIVYINVTGRIIEWNKDNKPIRMVGSHTNITAQKEAEQRLKKAQDLLNKTSQIALVGGWEMDLLTSELVWTKATKKIHDLPDDYEVTLEKALSFFSEEDQLKLKNAIENAIATNTSYDIELNMTTATGRPIIARAMGTPECEDGVCVRMLGAFQDITKQKQAENTLKRIEQMLSETQSLTHSGSWEQNLVTGHNLWSPEAFRIFGLQPAAEGPSTQIFSQIIHPEDQPKYAAGIRKAIKEGISSDIELRLLLPDGTLKYIQAIGQPGFDEHGRVTKLYGAIQDITARKNAEAFIRLKQEQLHKFIDESPAGIAMLDRNMNYIAASKVWKRNYELKEDIIGRNHYQLFPQAQQKWRENHVRCLNGEVLKSDEDFFIRPDGKTEWLKWEIRPWYEKENEIGGIILFNELITEQKEAHEALIKAKEQAEQAAQFKSQFLSTMSHEIRTPMNAVIGFTHLLLMQEPREDQREYLNILKFSAENLLVLINDILDFNKIEAGKIEFEEVDFSIKELVSNIRAASLQKATEKGIQLKLMVDEDLPFAVKGDPVRIGQIITNLVSNAVKFTSAGKVQISASLIQKTNTHTVISFEVSDTGIGIPPDKQDAIFESFTQANTDTTRKYGGTGLGLTITKRLLELQGSQIHVRSKENQGSTFYFDLSLKNSSAQWHKPEAETDKYANQHQLKGLKLLIAEDNQINVLLAKQFFKRWEIESDVAENGIIALQLIQTNDYDVVLMDLQMPGKDGYQTTEEIRHLPGDKYKNLPIIALTASAMLDIKDRAFTIGMNDYVSKPFNPDELYRKIARYARKKTRV